MKHPILIASICAASLTCRAADDFTGYPNLNNYELYDRDADAIVLCMGVDQFGFWHPASLGLDLYSEVEMLRRLTEAPFRKNVLLVVFSNTCEIPRSTDADEYVSRLGRRLRKVGFARVGFYAVKPSKHWE